MMKDNGKLEITPIAYIENDYTGKFGIPRQSGIVPELKSKIVFCREYRSEDAIRGISGFSHLWLIWGFSESPRTGNPLTVRPPRLGGNERMGVFATRSPYRPNPLGLSCVRLSEIEKSEHGGNALIVTGADLMNGTPIYDIKPYLPYTDRIDNALGGFSSDEAEERLEVIADENILSALPENKARELKLLLSCDPRPRYQDDPERMYGLSFAGYNVRFRVGEHRLYVIEIAR